MTHQALTVRQPFASLIVAGMKTIENRPKPIRMQGRIVIHAGKQPHELATRFDLSQIESGSLPVSAILGTVQLVGCHYSIDDRGARCRCAPDSGAFWQGDPGVPEPPFHWELAGAREFVTPIPRIRGALSFWVPDESASYLIDVAEVLP